MTDRVMVAMLLAVMSRVQSSRTQVTRFYHALPRHLSGHYGAGMLLSLLFAAAIVAIGCGLTYGAGVRLRFEERLAIGTVVGVFAVSFLTFVGFEVFGMGWAAIATGLAGTSAMAALAVRGQRSLLRADVRSAARRLRLRSARPSSLRPLLIVTVAAGAVATRIMSLSYQATSRGVSAGSLAVWGDWSAHLAYAGSFAFGDNRSLRSPIASGHSFSYHFLADFFGAMFTVTGATLQQGLVISAWLLAMVFTPLLWLVVMRLTRSRLTAFLTLLLFTLSGGVGLWYFAEDVSRNGWHIVTSLPRTYARIPEAHLWVDNTISASLYAQRSTLFGLCAGFCALVILLAARPSWSTRGFAFAGVLMGATGIAHAQTLLAGIALGGLAFLVDRRRTWLWFLIPAIVIGGPLAYSIAPETNHVRWLVGWMAPQSNQSWPWFWLRNVGLLLPLFVGIALFGGVPKRLRRLTAPLWLFFIAANLIAFHPSEWNNTKYFLIWQLGGCLVIAALLSTAFTEHRRGDPARPTRRAWRSYVAQFAAVLCVLLMISAGALDALRSMQRSTAIAWVEHDDVAAAEWLREHSATDAVIVYGYDNNSAVAALSGRRAVSGYPGWTYDLGLSDWYVRQTASQQILAGTPDAAANVARFGVDYVVIGPKERIYDSASDAYWTAHGTVAFIAGAYTIYRTAPRR